MYPPTRSNRNLVTSPTATRRPCKTPLNTRDLVHPSPARHLSESRDNAAKYPARTRHPRPETEISSERPRPAAPDTLHKRESEHSPAETHPETASPAHATFLVRAKDSTPRTSR